MKKAKGLIVYRRVMAGADETPASLVAEISKLNAKDLRRLHAYLTDRMETARAESLLFGMTAVECAERFCGKGKLG